MLTNICHALAAKLFDQDLRKKERKRERGGKRKENKRQNDVYRDLFEQKNCTKLKMKLGRHAANEISLRHCLIHSFRYGAICLFYVL